MSEPSARDHSAGQALGGEWATRLGAGAAADELEAEALNAPAAGVIPAIKAVATTAGVSAVPLLERLGLSERRDLALAASEALGTIRASEAAVAAERIATSSSDKAVQKAARRSGYRLSSQGIHIAHATPESPATVGSREATLYRVIASAYDGAGNRAIWFAAERPLGGIYMLAGLLNDVTGLLDLNVRDTTRKRFAEQEAKLRDTDPMQWVELPFEYAKQLMQEAVTLSREAHVPVPPTYAVWSDLIGNPEQPLDQALVYQEVKAIEVRLHPTLERETPLLFEQPEVEPWFAPPERARKWARQLAESTMSQLIVTPESDAQRQDRILREAVKDLFPPKALHGLKRRLEETAYIFLRSGREQDARRAVAAAMTVEEQRPLQPPPPFVRLLAIRSLQIALEIDRSGVEPARLALAPKE